MRIVERGKAFYDAYHKYFLIFTAVLVVIALGVLVHHKTTTGSFISKGASLKGGVSIQFGVDENFQKNVFEEAFARQFPASDFTVRETSKEGKRVSIILEATDITEKEVEQFTTTYFGHPLEESSVQEFGAAISSSFFRQTIVAVIVALFCMGIVVFITFRTPLPSFFVMLSATSTLISTLAVTVLLDIRLSTAGIASLLMLIGYSIDTDILLTTRVLKRQEGGSIRDKTYDAMRTGCTQVATGLAAVLVGYFFTNSQVIEQIMVLLAIGFIFDLIYTWFQNAVILRWYLEKKISGGSRAP